MDDDSRAIDKGWDALPEYANPSGDADDAVTVSISTTPGEWLVNTVDAVVVPMSMAEVVEALQTHKLTDRSLVWRAGMQEWACVDKVPQLKLAARMPRVTAPSAAPQSPIAAPAPSKPPPKPVRSTPAPQAAAAGSAAPQPLLSRRSTLPFGVTTPPASQSRPANVRPSSPRNALPPASSREEPEVLAVYDRPAATISFDLSPVQPLRAPAPPTQTPAPQTLAPITTDSTQRRAPLQRNPDLSVVAASELRYVQRSSKRLVWISSLASAAAASLLTFLAARSGVPHRAAPPATREPVAAAAPALPTPPAVPAAAAEPSSTPTPLSAPTESLAAPVASTNVAPAKPKAIARRAKAVSAPPAPRPARRDADADGTTGLQPSAEPNPYDVKLEEDTKSAKPAPAAPRGSGVEADSQATEASASGSTSPGF